MSKSLAYVQTSDRLVNQMQSNIIPVVKTIANNPIVLGIILQNISLKTGDNTISHKLNRELQGWYLVRQRSAATIYDKQDANTSPDSTLVLNASTGVTVDIYVF